MTARDRPDLADLESRVLAVPGVRELFPTSALPGAPRIAVRATPDGSSCAVRIGIDRGAVATEVLTAVEAMLGNKKLPAAKRMQLLRTADDLLGLNLLGLSRHDLRLDPAEAPIEVAEIDRLIARRKQARAEKDFAASDAIRDELAAKGVEVMDGDALGWEWKL